MKTVFLKKNKLNIKTRELYMGERQAILKLGKREKITAQLMGISSTIWIALKKEETTIVLMTRHRTGQPWGNKQQLVTKLLREL